MIRCPHCKKHIRIQKNGACPSCTNLILIDGKYQIEYQIADGGFGRVYRATDLSDNKVCAIKRLRRQSHTDDRRIRPEIMLLRSRLAEFDFVPKFYEVKFERNSVYLIMEFIEGQTLDMFGDGFWTVSRVERFLNVLLGYLYKLHEKGIIHRDIKPHNIKRDTQGRYTLLDFGIAKEGMQTRTPFRGAGTMAYMPFEQFSQQTTSAQTDLFSLGVTAYELLTGQLPPNVEERLNGQLVLAPSVLLPDVPPRLEKVILNLIEFAPEDRPSSAAAALRMLNPPQHAPQSQHISPIFIGIAGLVLLIIGFMILSPQNDKPFDTGIPKQLSRPPSGLMAFSSDKNGQYDLYLANALNDEIINLTNSSEQEYAPVWSHAGRYLTYVAQIENDYAIGKIDSDTIQHSILTPITPGKNFGTPAPSPDGQLIVFNSGPEGNYDLFLMNADGTNIRPLVTDPGTDFCPAWLRDGSGLIYIHQDAHEWTIRHLELHSMEESIILTSVNEMRFIALSPDDKAIAFSMKKGRDEHIFTVPVKGGEPQQITSSPGINWFPSWSPDGNQLAYMSTRDQSDIRNPVKTYLYIVRLKGEGDRFVRLFSTNTNDRHPAWFDNPQP